MTTFSNLPDRFDAGVDYSWAHRRAQRIRFQITVRIVAFLVGFAIGFLGGRHAVSQTTITYYSGHPESAAVQIQCAAAGKVLAKQLKAFPHPASWRWMIVCDDASWPAAMKMAHIPNAELVYGSTYFEIRTTILRGSALREEAFFGVTAEHLVTHELGHILLNTPDENQAEMASSRLMSGQSVQPFLAKGESR